MEVTFPGSEFPGFPRIELTLPEGWRRDVAADAVIVGYDPASPAHFRTNVVVTVTRTRGDLPVEVYARRFAEEAGQDPTFQVYGESPIEVSGYPGVLRLQSRRPENLGYEVIQAQYLVLVPTTHAELSDLVQLHASAAVDAAEATMDKFRTMVSSLRATPWSPDGFEELGTPTSPDATSTGA